jgi:pSer/pThr/pTyr-binding forkhead associated (FHA) protein
MPSLGARAVGSENHCVVLLDVCRFPRQHQGWMPRLKVTDTSSARTEYEFDDFSVTIGRAVDNLIVIEGAQVSRYHAEVSLREGGWWLRDLGSVHGVSLNGGKIHEVRLADGDEFVVAGFHFGFISESLSVPAQTSEAVVVEQVAEEKAKPPAEPDKPRSKAKKKSPAKPQGKGKTKKAVATATAHVPSEVREPPDESVVPPPAPATAQPTSAHPELSGPPLSLELNIASITEEAPLPPSPRRMEPPSLPMPAKVEPASQPEPAKHVSRFSRNLLAVAAVIMVSFAAWLVLKPSPVAQAKPELTTTEPALDVVPSKAPEVKMKEPDPAPLPAIVASLPPVAPARVMAIPSPPKIDEAKSSLPHSKASDQLMRPADQPPPATEDVRMILFKPSASHRFVSRPVLSSDLRYALHFVKTDTTAPGTVDLMLNQRVLHTGLIIATESDMRFSKDSSSWMVLASRPSGKKMLILPDRSYPVEGSVEALLGNADFSSVAYVTRKDDESHLHLNGKKVSSYRHIQHPQISADGRHWAYIAVKNPQRGPDDPPAGERVVTDLGPGLIHDQITDLTLSEDGSRLAYIAHREFGSQAIYLDGRPLHIVGDGQDSRILQLTFAPRVHRFAWLLMAGDGSSIFHAEGQSPLALEPPSSERETSLFDRKSSQARILFSPDGEHVACAISGHGAALIRDNRPARSYPALSLDSLTFSPNGQKLALVSFHPLRASQIGADGVHSQPHAAVLNLDEKALRTVPIAVHQVAGAFPIILGGYSRFLFSPDSTLIASLFQTQLQEGATAQLEILVQGQKTSKSDQSIMSYRWSGERTLDVACQRNSEVYIQVIESEQAQLRP